MSLPRELLKGSSHCSPDGGSGGTSAGPLREASEGSSHCSPEDGCKEWEAHSTTHAVVAGGAHLAQTTVSAKEDPGSP